MVQFLDSWPLGLRFGATNQGVHYLSVFGREPVPILAERIFHHLPCGAAFQHRKCLDQRTDRGPNTDGELGPCRGHFRSAFRIFGGGRASHCFSLPNQPTNNTRY